MGLLLIGVGGRGVSSCGSPGFPLGSPAVTNQDDPTSDRDDSSDDDERSSSPDESPAPAPTKKRTTGSKKRSGAREGSQAGARKPPPSNGLANVAIAGVVALAVGAAGGWFGHEAQAKAKLRADSAPAPSGSAAASGPCNAWEKKICSSTGDQSAPCAEAKAALDLLTPTMCEVALAGVPATLAKVKASRASCDTLISRLCKDLPPGSAACTMVKERTPSFPPARCDEMLAHYDEVLGGLKQMDQEQGQQMGAAPPGALPPGAVPPGALPPGAVPPPGAAK